MGRALSLAAGASALVAVTACELTEISLVEVDDVVVVEAYALVSGPPDGSENRLWAFLHRSVGADPIGTVPGARVVITVLADGRTIELQESAAEECVQDRAFAGAGSCYQADLQAHFITPGAELTLDILTQDGRVLESITRVPGSFEVSGILDECALPRDTPTEISWSPSDGAWAYVNETRIFDLDDALTPEGIEAESPVFLLGLSISAADTTVGFPNEFGLFDRFDLEQDVAVRLQSGLPAGSYATVGITASDRNFVNWARGGNFNPSGQVRIPSVRGEGGTGVFASAMLRRFTVFVEHDGFPGPWPDCPVR
jgi:hypothetical protein